MIQQQKLQLVVGEMWLLSPSRKNMTDIRTHHSFLPFFVRILRKSNPT